jgi:DNA-binding Xre family transcriptional regulator
MIQNRIKEFIDTQQISVRKFIKETEISPRTGYDLYNNPNQIPVQSVLDKICNTYYIQPGEILTWIPTEKPKVTVYDSWFIINDETINWAETIENMIIEMKREIGEISPLVLIVKNNSAYDFKCFPDHPMNGKINYAKICEKLNKSEKARSPGNYTTWAWKEKTASTNPKIPSALTPKEVIETITRVPKISISSIFQDFD